MTLIKELIKKDILVLVTGCCTPAAGKAGLLVPRALRMAGPGLKEVCGALGVPPVLHVGSCVDNSRIMAALRPCGKGAGRGHLRSARGRIVSGVVFGKGGCDRHVRRGSQECYTHLGLPPNVLGSKIVTDVLLNGLEGLVGADLLWSLTRFKGAALLDARITKKRVALGLTP